LYKARKASYDKQKDFYTNIAKASNIDPQYIINDPFDFENQNTNLQMTPSLTKFQAPQNTGFVQMKAPNGKIVNVPESEVENAIAQGGQRI